MLDFLLQNDLLSSILAFAIVFIPAVFVHELGHFLAAKAVGITVLEFGVGFPPRIAKLFTWRETEFTLNAIPLGGFVRPLGEDMIRPVSEEETNRERAKLEARYGERNLASDSGDKFITEREELQARGFHNTKAVHEVKPIPRIIFMAAGAVFNFIFAWMVFVAIGLIGLPSEVGSVVGFATIPAGSALEDAGFMERDVVGQINGEYFASPEAFFDVMRESIGSTVFLEVRRTASDPVELIRLEFVPTQALVDLLNSAEPYVRVTAVEEDSPGDIAGLLPEDLITAFNGEGFGGTRSPAERLVELTNLSAGSEVILSVLRDGETFDLALVPRVNPPPGSGKIGIGIDQQFVSPDGSYGYVVGPQVETKPQSLVTSVNYGFDRINSVFGMLAEFPARLLSGNTAPEERRVVSVVGISQFGAQILQDSISEEDASPFLRYVALISIALGFTNLLPIPALDGGRILFVLVEMIRGKPIPPEREGLVHLVGVIFILFLSVFVIINDLVNPLTDSLIP